MASLSHSQSSWMLPVKVGVLSFTLLCLATALKFSLPTITDYSDLLTIWNILKTWLRPPYLYVVINGIIIAIVATSKLHHHKVSEVSPQFNVYGNVKVAPVVETVPRINGVYEAMLPEMETKEVMEEFMNPIEDKVMMDTKRSTTHNQFLATPPPTRTTQFEGNGVTGMVGEYDIAFARSRKKKSDDKTLMMTTTVFDVNVADGKIGEEDMTFLGTKKKIPEELLAYGMKKPLDSGRVYEDEVVISGSRKKKSVDDLVSQTDRPPVSGKIGGHRKSSKSVSEGGKALRVSKPKRQETLESTWKTITEGRSMSLTRHLRKSDTWERHDQHTLEDPKMTKSDTFNGHATSIPTALEVSNTTCPGPGKLRKDPSGSLKLKKDRSLGQDELNKKVEAFINKFNEDMRIQRQQSLAQYMEMINRGAH